MLRKFLSALISLVVAHIVIYGIISPLFGFVEAYWAIFNYTTYRRYHFARLCIYIAFTIVVYKFMVNVLGANKKKSEERKPYPYWGLE